MVDKRCRVECFAKGVKKEKKLRVRKSDKRTDTEPLHKKKREIYPCTHQTTSKFDRETIHHPTSISLKSPERSMWSRLPGQ